MLALLIKRKKSCTGSDSLIGRSDRIVWRLGEGMELEVEEGKGGKVEKSRAGRMEGQMINEIAKAPLSSRSKLYCRRHLMSTLYLCS